MLKNLFENIPSSLSDELFTVLHQATNLRVERIVSQGHCSPPDFWYDQEEHEWVVLLQGQAILKFEDHSLTLCPGDFVNIPARVRHRVEWTAPMGRTVWLAIFYKNKDE